MSTKRFLIFLSLVLALLSLSWGIDQAGAQVAQPPGAAGFNPNVDYNVPNFAYSPNIRKFINKLPGIGAAGCTTSFPPGTGTCNENENGQYIPLAQPNTATYPDADYYVLGATEYSIKLHSDLPSTKIRGYRQENATDPKIQNVSQYLGPIIIAKSYDPTKPPGVNGNGKPVRVLMNNRLPLTTDVSTHGNLFLPVDPSIMGAGPGPTPGKNFTQNRISTHLHGGATPWISDGTPNQWLTPANEPAVTGFPLYQKGASFANVPDMVTGSSYTDGNGVAFPQVPCIGGTACFAPLGTDGKSTLYYSNQQSSRLMFYHDHAYGITRLNVYAGLAAPYLLTDQVEEDMISGTNVSGAFTAGQKVLPDLGGVYHYGIPLVIQDKTFVNDGSTPPGAGFPAGAAPTPATLMVDPRWYTTGANGVWAANFTPPAGGSLWFPHEYMPNQDIYDPSGANPLGRWDYGPWLNPAAVPLNSILPTPSTTPEAFMDTMLVNGTPYPYVTVPPTGVRFRILNACNDRTLNLSLFVADPDHPTETKMVPAVPNPAAPTWPVDGRYGGVPDPATVGPPWYMIGNEGGIMPQVTVIPAQPVVFEQSRLLPTVLGIAQKSLFIMPAVRTDVVVDFSAYAGKTLILYNDAPAASPLFDDRYDLFYGQQDYRSTGGAPPTQAGFGPNTRTIMQIRVSANGAAPFNLAALQAALPKAYAATQAPPIVNQAAYNPAFHPNPADPNKYVDTYVNNTDSTVNLLGTAQSVSKVITALGGSGYSLTPPLAVSFVPANGEPLNSITPATATAGIDGVTAVTVTALGTGYVTAPTVTIAPPSGCVINGTTCVQAIAVATVSGGGITAVTIVDPGSGYTPGCLVGALPADVNPTVTFTPTLGTPSATATLTCGAVAHIQVTSGGAGYTKAPFVYITGGGGTGATADARLTNDTVVGMKNITEGTDINFGRLNALLGTTPVPLDPLAPAPAVPGIAQYLDPPSDIWNDGQVYVFRLAHLGVDNHAVHFHLANLQVVNRIDYTNTMLPPGDIDLGWKETVRTEPFTDLILAVQARHMTLPFPIPRSVRLTDTTTLAGSTANYIQPAPVPGTPAPAPLVNTVVDFGWEYVWHCHLLGHEENDMMRPIVFNPILMGAPTGVPAPNTTLGKPFWYTNGGPAPAEPVVFTAGALPVGGVASDHYRFTLNYVPTSTGVPVSTVVQNWNTLTTWTSMTGFPAGSYTLTVDAGTGAAPAAPDVTGELSFDIVNSPATGVTLTVSPASPHVNGTAITFTATGAGSTGYQYRFNLNGTPVGDYSTTAAYTLPFSTPPVPATYSMTADVRTNPLSTTPDATSTPQIYTVNSAYDFDGDGKLDIPIWRPGDGNWYILGTLSTFFQQWGQAGDIPVPGDYTGDGKADMAVWRPGDGNWYIRSSADGTVTVQQWGQTGDIPVPGDYFGDGNMDFAVWRPGDGNWYIRNSGTGTVMVQQWGASSLNDVPVPGDYDGDGKADIAVWRPNEGIWYIRNSADSSVTVQQWGSGALGDIPVPGYYNGNKKMDIAVWRPNEGNWYIRNSNTGTVTVQQWGQPGDIPVPGDYDGDGKTDIAVWRPSEGKWYILRSSDGVVDVRQWGSGGLNDIPISSNTIIYRQVKGLL